jgi:hypothetical protein
MDGSKRELSVECVWHFTFVSGAHIEHKVGSIDSTVDYHHLLYTISTMPPKKGSKQDQKPPVRYVSLCSRTS